MNERLCRGEIAERTEGEHPNLGYFTCEAQLMAEGLPLVGGCCTLHTFGVDVVL